MTSQYFGQGVSGGAIGGFHTLETYHEGVLSAEKARLIRNIAQDLQGILKFPDDIANQPIDRIITILKSKVPNPKTHSLSHNKDVQKHICYALAQAINNRYGRVIIDTTASPQEVCEQAWEVMQTLFGNLKGEFMSVAQDVKRTLGNLAVLRRTLESGFDKLYEAVQSGSDDMAKLQSYNIRQLYEDVLHEIDRQMAILANIVNVTIDPTTRTIADITEQDRDFRGLIKSLKSELGTPDLSRKMTYMLAGVNTVAMLADTIDRALKKIGSSVQEYKKYSDTPQFIEHLRKAFEKSDGHHTSDELAKFVAAVQLVKQNDYAHDDIVDYLSRKTQTVKAKPGKAVRRMVRGKKAKKVRGRGVGGAEGENSLEKRLERQRKAREVLFRDFEQRLEQQYKQIFGAIEVLSKRIGGNGATGIPVDDHLQRFVRCMQDLDQAGGVDREKFYLAISGYQQDAASKEERQRFLGQLESVSKSLKPLIAGPSGEYFKTVKDSVDRLIETIDTFKETYLRPITSISVKPIQGGGDKEEDDLFETEEATEEIHGQSRPVLSESDSSSDEDEDQKVDGGAKKKKQEKRDDNVEHEIHAAEAAIHHAEKSIDEAEQAAHQAETQLRSADAHLVKAVEGAGESRFVTLGQAIRHLEFFFNVAKVKHNLAIASKDIKGFSKDYETILGDAIGDMVIRYKKEYENQKKMMDSAATPLPPDAHEARLLKAWINAPNEYKTDGDWKAEVKQNPVTGKHDQDGERARVHAYRQSVKDSALKYLKETMNVKIELLKTVEAIDIYLANFADAIASNPNDIKELNQLLKSVDIVAKWFTDKSGNTIAELFETAPSALVDNYEVKAVGDRQYTSTEDHYYKWVETMIRPDANDASKMRLPGNPFLGTMPGRESDDEDLAWDALLNKAQKAALSVRVLDNIISTFTKLGSQYGNLNLNNKTFMPPAVMFKNLRRYIFHSAIVMGMKGNTSNVEYKTEDGVTLKAESNVPHNAAPREATRDHTTHYQNAAICVGTSGHDAHADAKLNNAETELKNSFDADGKYITGHSDSAERYIRNKFAMAFSSIYNSDGMPINGFADTWRDTDRLLLMAIKSMVAKVFTVVGTYGLFNKPLDRYKGVTTTRLILGGDYSTPEIIPNAVELYIRLPLLAEFYREVFDFSSNGHYTPDASTDNKKITLVPEFDGIWENFVRIVFDDAKYVQEGTYSENHVKSLIREINEIYNRYKSAGDKTVVQDVISSFVAEINRRYGVVKQKEIGLYLKERRRFEAAETTFSPQERLDYNILDERDIEGRRPAPSDRYDHMFPPEERVIENKFKPEYIKLVTEFRERLDSKIKALMPSGGKPPKVSFDQSIRTYKNQVEASKTAEEKYKIVLRAMQGIDQLSSVNQQKAIMFHETVVAPLNTLHSIWTIMNRFIMNVQAMDLLDIESVIDEKTVTGAGTYRDYYTALSDKRRGYMRYLKTGDATHVDENLDGTNGTYLPSWTAGTGDDRDIVVHRGTYGARFDITWYDIAVLSASTPGATDDRKNNIKEGIRRFVVDREKMFQDMINLCFSLGADLGDLASVKVQTGNILIEYGVLAEYCQTLLDSVKKNLEHFRGVIDAKVIARVEGGTSKSSEPDAGSIYFLDEHLMERIFKDSRQGGTKPKSYKGIGIIKANDILSRNFKQFIKPWNVTANVVELAAGQPAFQNPADVDDSKFNSADKLLLAHEKSLLQDSFERPMANLLYWTPASQVKQVAGATSNEWRNRPGGGTLTNRPLIEFSHPLRQPLVRNTSVNDWPYAVIPAVERTGTEDDDIKAIKTMHEAMDALRSEIKNTLMRGGAQLIPEIVVPDMPPPLAVGANAAARAARAARVAARSAIIEQNINRYDAIFVYPDGAPAGLGTLDKNYGVECSIDIIQMRFNAMTDVQKAAAKPMVDRAKELAGRYNALYKQRERIFQSSIHAPLDHRVKLYTDPANAEEGEWFLGQLKPEEATAGVSQEDRTRAQFDAGLLVRFNEILSKYLYNGWDTTTKKMYAGLIAKFANGTHVAATSKGQAINDIDDAFFDTEVNGLGTGIIGVPAQHVVIFATIARAMRNVMVNTRKSGDPEFRIESMMELPIHMKETLRANLPHFDKLFKLVIKKAELLRQVSQQVSLVRQLPYLLKYGINRNFATADPGAQSTVPNGLYGAGINGHGDWSNVPTSPISWAASAVAIAIRGGEPESAPHVSAAPNTALLNRNDVMHVDTGFVIRNASSDVLKAVEKLVQDTAAGYGTDPAITPGHCRWIHGAGTNRQAYEDGKRFVNVWATKMCNNKSDLGATAYTGFQPYEELGLEASKRWHTEVVDSITLAAMSIDKCVQDTYKELADEPKYLETHEGFINDYVNLNKYQPIMLLSQLQVALKQRFRDDPEWDKTSKSGYARPNFMLPLFKSGESPFKLAYGSRLIMGRPDVKPTLEYMPGMSGLLERYNGVSSSDTRIDKSDYERFTIAHTNLLRFITDLRFYRAVLDTDSSGRVFRAYAVPPAGAVAADVVDKLNQPDVGASLFDTPLSVAPVDDSNNAGLLPTPGYAYDDALKSYTARCTLDEDIAITESSDQETTTKNIVGTVSSIPQPVYSRENARIYNIIDMNIVPINLHALMREIPLINLINYSYTCDRMIQDALLPENELPDKYRGKLIPESSADFPIRSSRAMLTKMLIYPYARLTNEEFYGYLARIATGDSGLDLGRPKFISDQMWNKVLLQELYTQPIVRQRGLRRPDESGPAADNAQRRVLKSLHEHPETIRSFLATNIANLLVPFGNTGPAAGADQITQEQARQIAAAVIRAVPNNLLNLDIADNHQVISAVQAVYKPLKIIVSLTATNDVPPAVVQLMPHFRNIVKIFGTSRTNSVARQILITALLFVMIEEQLRDGSEPDIFENNGSLSYPAKTDNGVEVKQVDFTSNPANEPGTAIRHDLAQIGRMRFDTTFIRNLFFLTNLQRVMRMIMRDEVSYLESPVVNSNSVINRQVTEFESNETFDAEVFHN